MTISLPSSLGTSGGKISNAFWDWLEENIKHFKPVHYSDGGALRDLSEFESVFIDTLPSSPDVKRLIYYSGINNKRDTGNNSILFVNRGSYTTDYNLLTINKVIVDVSITLCYRKLNIVDKIVQQARK
jgi:hypothetical protein